MNEQQTHSHPFHLPKFLSYSGQKPSSKARIQFVLLGVVMVVILANAAVAALLEGRMYPGVSVAGHDISFLSRQEAFDTLQKYQLDRQITLKVGDKVFTTKSSDLGAEYDLRTTIDTAYSTGRSSRLPLFGIFQLGRSGELGFAYNVNTSKLKAFTDSVVQSVGHDPVDATVVINNGVVGTQGDSPGLRIDQKALNNLIRDSISDGKDQNLSLTPQVTPADIRVDDLGPVKQQAEEFLTKRVSLVYEGKVFVADRNALGHMVAFVPELGADGKKRLVMKVVGSQVAGYVGSVANKIDFAPVSKKINVENGIETVDREGKDGLAINQDPAINAIVSALGRGQDIEYNLTSRPVAFKTEKRSGGALGGLTDGAYIEVSLGQQRLWAWQNGQVIFTTPITSGATGAGFPTVQGTFAIFAKERSRYLNGRPYGWNYNVYVDYWMPFYAGYGLHDADWRSSFGGGDFYYGGSHGCVNMPKAAAAFLYGWAGVGTTVWVHG